MEFSLSLQCSGFVSRKYTTQTPYLHFHVKMHQTLLNSLRCVLDSVVLCGHCNAFQGLCLCKLAVGTRCDHPRALLQQNAHPFLKLEVTLQSTLVALFSESTLKGGKSSRLFHIFLLLVVLHDVFGDHLLT